MSKINASCFSGRSFFGQRGTHDVAPDGAVTARDSQWETESMNSNRLPQIPILNREELLERMMGSTAMAERMLNRFLDTADADCDLLESAVRLGDCATTASLAHRHRGTAKTMAAARVAHVAAELEKGALTEPASSLLELVNQMRTLHEEVREVAEREFGRIPSERGTTE